MVFAEALTEYLIDGLSEALAKADEPTPPAPLQAQLYGRYSPCEVTAPTERDGHTQQRVPRLAKGGAGVGSGCPPASGWGWWAFLGWPIAQMANLACIAYRVCDLQRRGKVFWYWISCVGCPVTVRS